MFSLTICPLQLTVYYKSGAESQLFQSGLCLLLLGFKFRARKQTARGISSTLVLFSQPSICIWNLMKICFLIQSSHKFPFINPDLKLNHISLPFIESQGKKFGIQNLEFSLEFRIYINLSNYCGNDYKFLLGVDFTQFLFQLRQSLQLLQWP